MAHLSTAAEPKMWKKQNHAKVNFVPEHLQQDLEMNWETQQQIIGIGWNPRLWCARLCGVCNMCVSTNVICWRRVSSTVAVMVALVAVAVVLHASATAATAATVPDTANNSSEFWSEFWGEFWGGF